MSHLSGAQLPHLKPTASPCRVYTDVQQVLSHLTHPRFTFTPNEADADVLYNLSLIHI